MSDESMEEDTSHGMVEVEQLQDKNTLELLAEFERRRRVFFSIHYMHTKQLHPKHRV
jgi:hypothetical protein